MPTPGLQAFAQVTSAAPFDGADTFRRDGGKTNGLGFYLVVAGAGFGALIGLTHLIGVVRGYEDYASYINMTAGDFRTVGEPFASRRLGPFLASLLQSITGSSAASALEEVVLLGWGVAALAAGLVMWRVQLSPRWTWVLATLPFPAISAGYYFVPDSITVALVLLLVFASLTLSGSASFLTAGLAMLARSTSALSIVLWTGSLAWRRLSLLKILLASTAGIVAGVLLKKTLLPSSAENIHHLSGPVYLVGKTAANASLNLLGVQLYANTTDWCPRPAHVLSLRGLPALGRLETVGVCGFQPLALVTTACSYAFILGVTPYLAAARALALWRAGRWGAIKEASPLIVFFALFLISPVLGSTTPRLFIEAYPLVFAVLPLCVAPTEIDRRTWAGLLAFNLTGFAVLSALSHTRV